MDDGPGDKVPKRRTRTATDGITHNTSRPVFVGLNNWSVLTPDSFRGLASNQRLGMNQNRANVNREASSYPGGHPGATPQNQYSPLPQQGHMGNSIEETIDFESRIDPALLAQDSFAPSATSAVGAPRASSYHPGIATGSGTNLYNEGLIAGTLYRGVQNQQRIDASQNVPKNGSSNTTDTGSTASVMQPNRKSQNTGNPSMSSGGPKKWIFINKGPADFETPRKVGRCFAQPITPSLNVGLSYQNQPHPSTGAADASRLCKVAGLQSGVPGTSGPAPDRAGSTWSTPERQMPQSYRSATYGAPTPSHYRGFGVPQSPGVILDSRQFQVSGARSSNEMQNETASYQNCGIAGLSVNDPSDNNIFGVRALSTSQVREGPINSGNRQRILIAPVPAVSGPSHGALGASFPQNRISAQQGVGQFLPPPQQPGNGLNNMDFCFVPARTLPTYRPIIGYRELQLPQQSLGQQFGGTVSIPDQFASRAWAQTPKDISAHMRQRISNQAQVFGPNIADQVQLHTASTNTGPSGSIPQSTVTTCLNRGSGSSNNELDQQSLPIATPAVTQEHSITAPLPLASVQHGTNTNSLAQQQALLRSFSENQPGSWANNQGSPAPVQHQDRLSEHQPFPLQSAAPTESLRGNRYVPDEVVATTPRYDLRLLSSGRHVPVSAANNQAQVSGISGVNPMQAGTPAVAQPGAKSSVPAPVTCKRQRKRVVSNSSAGNPPAKKGRLMLPETQAGSSCIGAKRVVDTRRGNNSASAGSSSSKLADRNTDYPYLGYFPLEPTPGSQQHQPGTPPAPPKPPTPTGVPAGPQNSAPIPQEAYFQGGPNQELLEKMLKILPAMVAKQDAILSKFREYEQVYGPTLYAFYMGDPTSNPRPELRMTVTEEDEVDMQDQGQALLQVTQDISNTLLRVIMNMTDEQSAPNFNSLMYFCNCAGLRNAIPVVERVANARLMASMILGEEPGWQVLLRGTSTTDPIVID